MEKNHSFENSNDSNIKKSIELILGTSTVLRKGKKTLDDSKKDLFCEIIDLITQAEERSIILSEMYHVDLSSHNNIFFAIMQKFFVYSFNPDQVRIIQFYIYERYTEEGLIKALLDNNKNEIPLNSHADLWECLKTLK